MIMKWQTQKIMLCSRILDYHELWKKRKKKIQECFILNDGFNIYTLKYICNGTHQKHIMEITGKENMFLTDDRNE